MCFRSLEVNKVCVHHAVILLLPSSRFNQLVPYFDTAHFGDMASASDEAMSLVAVQF